MHVYYELKVCCCESNFHIPLYHSGIACLVEQLDVERIEDLHRQRAEGGNRTQGDDPLGDGGFWHWVRDDLCVYLE